MTPQVTLARSDYVTGGGTEPKMSRSCRNVTYKGKRRKSA
jgi:hypothetical protein